MGKRSELADALAVVARGREAGRGPETPASGDGERNGNGSNDATAGTARKAPTERATFIVPRAKILRLKMIALREGRLYKDVVAEALDAYIEGWEKAHPGERL